MPKKYKIVTLGKTPRKMCNSLIQNSLPGIFVQHLVIEPTANTSQTSSAEDIFENADTEDKCSPNSIVKYMNFTFECAIADGELENAGWIEWGLVTIENQNSSPAVPGNSNLGVQTAQQGLIGLFRNRCLMTGSFPVAKAQPIVMPLTFKLPNICMKNAIGKYLVMYWAFRSVSSTDTTTVCRTVTTHNYKAYI